MPKGTQIHPTSTVSPDAEVGRDVTIGPYTVIQGNVSLGDGSFVDSHALIGAPTATYYADAERFNPAPCRIGQGAVIRSHAVIYNGATIGDGFECGHHVTVREGTQIGVGVRIGTSSDVQAEASIGDYARTATSSSPRGARSRSSRGSSLTSCSPTIRMLHPTRARSRRRSADSQPSAPGA